MTALALLGFSLAGVLVLGVTAVVLIGKRATVSRNLQDEVKLTQRQARMNARYAETHPQCTAERDSVLTNNTAETLAQQAAMNYGRRRRMDWQPENVPHWERQSVPQEETAVRDSKGEVAYDVTDRWPRKGKLVKR